ncbi:histidine phosphatase family protein [Ideonella sp. B7]|uniref:histidine phosphatase family protein n=1 Tax=Ideonella benzenivorans TaxID=2831643 RepID=UPI001CEC7A5C|nr:histidine phosphatase family protein [Ideonella benzenivorans]MCA6215756.1 histidine phosphatase family protein [Ideonella benzenivorans]
MALILARHTRVDLPAGTCYGQADVPLLQPHDPPFDGVGQRLGALLARIGDGTRVAQVVSSPLRRARLLAEHLSRGLGQPTATDPRWMELDFGAWEGRRWDDIPRAESDPWAEDTLHRAPPGGETQNALIARVQAALAALHAPASRPGEAVLVVAHAGPLRVALAAAQGWVPSADPQQAPVSLDFGGLTWLDPLPAGGWVLRALNA